MKKRSLLIYFLFFLSLTLVVSGQKLHLDNGQIKEKKFKVEVPFELVLGKIVLPVSLNGISYRFLLDTGAPNLVSKELSESLESRKKKDISVTDANNEKETMQMVSIPSLKLGDIHYENGVAIVADLRQHPLLACYEIDGFIGSNFFKKAVLKIDMTQKKLFIANDSSAFEPQGKGYEMKLIGPQLSPHTEVFWENTANQVASEMALIDTGMDGFYDLSNRAYKILSEQNVFTEMATTSGFTSHGLFGAAETQSLQYLKSSSLTIGPAIYQNVLVETTSDDNSRIGLDLFKYGVVIMDFKAKRIYYEAFEATRSMSDKIPSVSPNVQNGKLIIGAIWDDTLKKSIKVGDVILSINGTDITSLKLCDIFNLLKRSKAEGPVDLTVATNEKKIIELKIIP